MQSFELVRENSAKDLHLTSKFLPEGCPNANACLNAFESNAPRGLDSEKLESIVVRENVEGSTFNESKDKSGLVGFG